MSVLDTKTLVSRQNRRYVFGIFRRQARYAIIPTWLAFGVIDYLYQPDLWPYWLALRLISVVAWWSALPLLKIEKVRRKHYETLAIVESAIAANVINVMIATSGGASSVYIPGVILTAVCCTAIFRLGWKNATILNVLSYGPCVAIIWLQGEGVDWRPKLVMTALLGGMTVLSTIFRNSEEMIGSLWAEARLQTEGELTKLRRTEFLKKHFPEGVRRAIESGKLTIGRRQIIPSAVVGFADITSSTAIANKLDLTTDWDLKERFLIAATRRATECGLIVLTHTGDGFLFLANFFDGQEWTYNLVSFYEGLQRDFDEIRSTLGDRIVGVETGIKCAVTMGPAIIGFIGEGQSYFTVMGPTVNLAARLCGKASRNEIVVSSRVWDVLKHVMIGWPTRETRYDTLKGFDHPIGAVHISPRTSSSRKNGCPTCAAPMTVVRTLEGFIDVLCPNCKPSSQRLAA